MNYKESVEILKEIKKAESILVNCHRNPDPDSVGSALAMYWVLKGMGKKVRIVFPGEELPQNLKFLEGFEKIDLIDYSKFDFSPFNLFVALDSSSWYMVSGNKDTSFPKIPFVVIDHHLTNKKFGKVNLVDEKTTSTGHLLYLVFEDWGVEIEKKTATALLTGIIGDTGVFRYAGTGWPTLEVSGRLMKIGANKDQIVFNLYNSSNIKLVKFWAAVISKMEIDEKYKFVWSAISNKEYVQLGSIGIARETAASQFAGVVEGTDFGIIMVENRKNSLSISLRSRTGFDTTKMAIALGGGGHIFSSGARIEGLEFDQAVAKVLETARKFANENKS